MKKFLKSDAFLIFVVALWLFVLFLGNAYATGIGVSGSGVSASSFTGGTITGTLSSTKPCASGYTRAGPNYCRLNAAGAISQTLNTSGACVQSPALTGVTDATGVEISVEMRIASLNAVGGRAESLGFFGIADATCAAGIFNYASSFAAYEFVAVAAGTIIRNEIVSVKVATNSTGQYMAKLTNDAGTFAVLRITGYYD